MQYWLSRSANQSRPSLSRGQIRESKASLERLRTLSVSTFALGRFRAGWPKLVALTPELPQCRLCLWLSPRSTIHLLLQGYALNLRSPYRRPIDPETLWETDGTLTDGPYATPHWPLGRSTDSQGAVRHRQLRGRIGGQGHGG